ncbi:hypothetical protein TNCT_319171 [Trichonephila clavata]|uniref:Granulins domain-containing protein n=1 Tax=Trichonephila clavata TaxID=2740835 RepID=A0A8X6G5W8_TRICU|nr:hypothetical protein TNCT_319171 [Trichonephila clavata]
MLQVLDKDRRLSIQMIAEKSGIPKTINRSPLFNEESSNEESLHKNGVKPWQPFKYSLGVSSKNGRGNVHSVPFWHQSTSFCSRTLKGTWHRTLEVVETALKNSLNEFPVDDFQERFSYSILKMLAVFLILVLFGSIGGTSILDMCEPDVCEPNETCCRISSGDWNCCPYKNGVCCRDDVHCCPEGLICSLNSLYCFLSSVYYDSNQMQKRQGDEYEEDKFVSMQVRFHLCSEETMCFNSTCCELGDSKSHFKKHGCCPFVDGVCCPDGKHCCRSTETCDESSESCIKEDGSMASAFPSLPPLNRAPFHNFVDHV